MKMASDEEYFMVISQNRPIYDLQGNVLIERKSDGYQFYASPDCIQSEQSNNDGNQCHYSSPENVEDLNSDNTINEEQTPQSHWLRADILKLINEYKNNKENFASTAVRNCKVWQNISKTLKTHSPAQCENKFKYLKSKYLKKKDNMSQRSSGCATVNFEFFEEFEEIFKKDPSVEPVAIASSSRANPINLEGDQEMSETQSPNPTRQKKIKLKDALNDLNQILKETEESKERRHKELLDFQKELLNSYNDVMKKILDKL